MAQKRMDIFGHDKRDRAPMKAPPDTYHIWPYEGTPHPVRERHKTKKDKVNE